MNIIFVIPSEVKRSRGIFQHWKIPPLIHYRGIGRNDTGQTIVELLVALTLITLFLSGVVVVQLYAIRNVSYAQKRSQATKLAREQLERLRVVRDSVGMDNLSVCLANCYINSALTPVPISPTGMFGQIIQITTSSDAQCPPPENITPVPVIYKATAHVNWAQGAINITPAAQLEVSSCITDWR